MSCPSRNRRFRTRSVVECLLVLSLLCLATLARSADRSDRKIEVCHRPPGKPSAERVIEVGSERALEAHLAHGDKVFGFDLDGNCARGRPSFRIDSSIQPTAPQVAGFRGGPPRPLGVIEGAGGGRNEYIVNEVLVRPETSVELQGFLETYGGRILADDTVLIGTEGGGTREIPGGADGAHVIEIDPSTSALFDLPRNALAAGISGAFAFSSTDALRTFALQLRERAVQASLNVALYPDALLEHPDDDGFLIDFATRWWMRDDEDGPSTGVARAIRYLRHTGLPPTAGVWTPARLAIIDGGFNLDPESGLGSSDYFDPFTPPLQVDAVDYDGRAGGRQGGWHGEMVFGTCCAYPRNGFGSAGTGGDLIEPIAIKATTVVAGQPFFFSSDVHYAIYAAWLMSADVINMSLGCNRDWTGETGPLCALNSFTGGNLQSAVFTGIVDGGVVVASSGNGDDNDISDDDVWPCELDAVICVGGTRLSGENAYNWGDGVDISAPGVLLKTTVTPASAALDANTVGFDELADFSGTSAAAPFVSGVAGLLKAADLDDPSLSLRWDDVEEILQATANCAQSPSPCPQEPRDPHLVKGYVDALRAVQSVRDNPPPTARIAFLSSGDKSWARPIEFVALLDDPPAPWGFVGSIRFSSSLEGELCTADGDSNVLACTASVPTLGPHTITLVATDEFGAVSAPDTVDFEVVNAPPMVTLLNPEDGSTRFADQLVVFRAEVRDADFEDYDRPCPRPGEACVSWSSSIDGDITPGTPPVLDFVRSLSVGEHTVTLTATDGKGETVSASTSLTIDPSTTGQPTARILSATDGADGQSTILVGRGTDPEDGELPDSALRWFSDVDGELGTGRAIEVILSNGGCESRVDHTIRLEATDSAGNVDADTIVVPVIIVC